MDFKVCEKADFAWAQFLRQLKESLLELFDLRFETSRLLDWKKKNVEEEEEEEEKN